MKLNPKRVQASKAARTEVREAVRIASGGEDRAAGQTAYRALETETRAGVETECAAFHLNRRAQTLRVWASRQNGPLQPLRVNGRLMWPTSELRRLCGVAL